MESQTKGVCPICQQPATLKCAGCKQEFYCNKSHQRQDWSRHRSICQAWEVHVSAELGRHLLASRDLNPDDVILSESPLIWGPTMYEDNQRICVGCGEQSKSSTNRCRRCLWSACDCNCPGLTNKLSHQMECSLLRESMIIPRSDVLLVVRMLILWHKKAKQWTALEKLQSHEKSRGPETEAYGKAMEISRHIERLLSIIGANSNIVSKICGLIDVNALETLPPKGCVAIYDTVCLLEHSCMANTKHSFVIDDKGTPRITVRAVCPIKKGEHLSTMYTHALWATKARRAHLQETKYFSCCCKRCADPTELGSHLSTLICPNDNGFILPKDPLDFESEWACNSCPGVLTASEVTLFLSKLEKDVDEIMFQPSKKKLIDLLSRLNTLLHPGHQQSITVSQSVIQILSPRDPRKAELCKRILETTKLLDPYNARVPLYTAVALRELSSCPGEDKQRLLEEALSLLMYEPKNSPGDKLRDLIESEL